MTVKESHIFDLRALKILRLKVLETSHTHENLNFEFLYNSLSLDYVVEFPSRQSQNSPRPKGERGEEKEMKTKTKIFENVENRKQDREICSSMEISENDIIIYSKKE